MQNIGVHIQDDKGKPVKDPKITLEESKINFADVMSVVYKEADYKKKYPLLSTIDPYDDTIFNSLQTAQLIQELSALPSDEAAIKNSITLLKQVGQFQYVEFYGD